MKRLLITICGRAGSKGFKNKNLKNFCGKPLVYYSLSAAELFIKNHPELEVDIALNTDSEDLAKLVAAEYPEVIYLPRGAELGGDRVPKVEVYKDSFARMEARTGKPYDAEGRWARSGHVLPALLRALLAEPFFAQAPPKSTGRDLFHPQWLATHLQASGAANARPEDVQATLLELTARTCAADVQRHAAGATTLIVCGGGARNTALLQRLSALLSGLRVDVSDDHGLPAQQVEAAAFAWLAQRCIDGLPGNLAAVTGARGPRVLGAIYPA